MKNIYALRQRQPALWYDCVVVADSIKHARMVATEDTHNTDYADANITACRRIGEAKKGLGFGVIAG